MRICCVEGCGSRATETERSLFKINKERKEWMEIIECGQLWTEDRILYICDLHFDQNDMKKNKNKWSLKNGATPNRTSGSLNEINVDCNQKTKNPSTITSDYADVCDELHLPNLLVPAGELSTDFIQNIQSELAEPQMKTITLEQYEDLLQLSPQIEELKNMVKRMEDEIKRKNAETQLRVEAYERELQKWKEFYDFPTEKREVLNCLIRGKGQKQYSEAIREFCLRQYYYSPAAYQALRAYFGMNLPSRRTIQMWYSSVDGSPGINLDTLKIIREKAQSYETENHHKLHLTLISDEMSIKKQICWSNETQSFTGFSTITNSSQHTTSQDQSNPELKVAKDALVFMVVGTDFKLPVAYHLLNGLESLDRAALTLEVIRCVERTGARVMSLTSDGLKANLTVAELLGVKLHEQKTYFQSPTYPDQKIFIILDPPHMIKLVRKHFSKEKLYHKDELLNWELLSTLVVKQSSENFNLCNKLTQRHIDWYQKPMNVRLAVETISNSVADVLEQLGKDGYEEFKDCRATVEFLRFFNCAFDVLNFAENAKSDGYKQPICDATVEHIFSFLEKLKEYICNLNILVKRKGISCKKPLLQSTAKMGFLGFYVDAISLKGIYDEFVQNGPLKVFYPMQFSQDHLETFFSLIRNSQGRNDNPSSVEFRSAFRKLFICHPLTTSVDRNVITNAVGILTVSSAAIKRAPPVNLAQSQDFELEVDYEELICNEIEGMESYDHHTWAYIALKIEEKITKEINRANKSNCSDCASVFAQNQKVNDELLAMKNGDSALAKQPCESTLKIVIFSNAVMKMIPLNDRNANFNSVLKTICSNLIIEELYETSNFNQHHQQIARGSDHKEGFVKNVVKTFLMSKSDRIGERITNEERGICIRNRLKKKTHVAGQ